MEYHNEDASRYENYDGNGDGVLNVCCDDNDDGIPYGNAFFDIQGGKTSEIQNGNAGLLLVSGQNVQDVVGIQYGHDGTGILNSTGYEILGFCGFGENGDEFVHYVGVNLCGTLDYYGDAGGQTLCGVEVWLQNGNDNGGTGDDHGGDKIQSVYYCGNLDGNTDGALQTGVGCEGGDENNDHQDYGDVC